MSDFEKLINASDLIEWIMETYPDWCEGAVRGIVDHVDALPSAEPTYTESEIQKMQDLEQAQIEKAYQVGLEEGRTEQRWIPCSERLPRGWQWFYATCRSKVDDRENWVIEGMSNPWELWGDLPPMVKVGAAEIIAWMPKEFPEPWKEGEAE